MTNAPERIWIEDEFGDGDDDQWTYGTWDVRNYRGYTTEYVRADRIVELDKENDILLGEVEYLEMMRDDLQKAFTRAADTRDRLRAVLVELVQHTHNCERELTEDLHHVDFCEESVPLTNARAALKGETP